METNQGGKVCLAYLAISVISFALCTMPPYFLFDTAFHVVVGLAFLSGWWITGKPRREYTPPDPSELTCFKCPKRGTCKFVDDPYNTNGDCLAEK